MREDGSATKPGGTGLLAAGVVVAGVVAAGLYMTYGSGYLTGAPEPDADTASEAARSEPQEAPVTTPSTAEETVASDTSEPATRKEDVVTQALPSIDEVRVEDDGLTVIAGRAAPGEEVSVVVDGDEVAKTTADTRGAFATVVQVDPSSQARVLTLQSEREGETIASREEVILTPLPTPPAAAEPKPQQEAPTQTAQAETSNGIAPSERNTAETLEKTQPPSATTTDTVAGLSADAVASAPQPDVQTTPDPAETSPGTPSQPPVVTNDPANPNGPTQSEPDEAAPDEPETQSVAVLKSTSEGVELLQSDVAPAVNVDIDTIGYSDVGDIQLSGRAVPGSFEVRVYLDNRFVASLPVENQGGWRGTVPDVDEGIYTLRVDQVNTAGDVTSRLETPFKREAPAALAQAGAGLEGPVRAITVQTGDTLWAIARERYGEGVLFVRVFEANIGAIRDPDLIYPGQVFDLPIE